jgi:hypothetical protein
MTVRFLAAVAQGRDQRLGDAAQAEAADGEQLPIGDDAGKCRCGTRVDLLHAGRSCGYRRQAYYVTP